LGPLGHSLAAISAAFLSPLVAMLVLLRPRLATGLSERLGSVSCPVDGPVWVHGASVGEALASVRLIEELEARGRNVVASVATETGRQALERALPELTCILAPIDHPWCVERALKRIAPSALVLIETELWPFWIAAAKRRGVPVLVASGRLSDRSFPRYRRLRWLLMKTLRRLDAVGARSPLDAERFAALGVPRERIRVTGDLKLEPRSDGTALATDLVRALSEVQIFVAGSTHEGEEGAAVEVLAACRARELPVALVLAPRHPERLVAVEHELLAAGHSVIRRSELDGRVLASGNILLLDTIGELAAIYSAAAVAFVGGTLVPIGGHNLLEPLFAGCPVLFGPHVNEVRTLAELAQASGAGVGVENTAALVASAVELLENSEVRRGRGMGAKAFLEEHRGGAVRIANLIDEVAPLALHGDAGLRAPAQNETPAAAKPDGSVS